MMRSATVVGKLAVVLVLMLGVGLGTWVVTAEEPAPASPPSVAQPLEEALDLGTISGGPGWFDTCTTASLEDWCTCHCKLCANPQLGGGPENCRICQSATCNPL